MAEHVAAAGSQHVEFLSVDSLEFDPENPRLSASLRGKPEPELLSWMLANENILELMGSIAAQGYFEGEPLLATSSIQSASQGIHAFTVVEGNRRLAALKLLLNPGLATVRMRSVAQIAAEAANKPSSVPTIVFPKRDDILNYLGYRHVTGIKPWDPLAKARYVQQLAEMAVRGNRELDLKEIAKMIGSRSDYVARLLQGLRVLDRASEQAFYGLRGVNQETIDFAVLTTALSYSAIAQFVGVSPNTATDDEDDGYADDDEPTDPTAAGPIRDDNLRDLLGWMFRELPSGKTVLGESRNLKSLAKVVRVPAAVTALKEGQPLRAAAQLTEEPAEQFREGLRAAHSGIQSARDRVHLVERPLESDLTQVSEIATLAGDLRTIVRGRLAGEGSDA